MWSKKSKRRYYFREEETQMGTSRISPTLFDNGAVGLRIVAAMSGDSVESGSVTRGKARSDPIPIRGRVGPALRAAKEEEGEEEDDNDDDVKLSESYTCVITRVGGGTVRKRVYLDAGGDDGVGAVVVDDIGGKFEMNLGVFFESPPSVGHIPGDFLICCYLCRKQLHGLDIFMYRGDKAFCSAECRCQQILNDEHKKKCWPEAGKPRDSPLPLYLVPLPYDAGVAAA